MCSLSNAAVSFYVARELGAAQFGAFSLAYVTYAFALNASRGLATDPLLVRFSGTRPGHLAACRGAVHRDRPGCGPADRRVRARSRPRCLAVRPGSPSWPLAWCCPGLLLQDSWRYSFFALGRGSQAFINDTIWTLTLVPAAAVPARSRTTARVLVHSRLGCRGGGRGRASGRCRRGSSPGRPMLGRGCRSTVTSGLRYLVENTSNSGAGQLRIYGVGAHRWASPPSATCRPPDADGALHGHIPRHVAGDRAGGGTRSCAARPGTSGCFVCWLARGWRSWRCAWGVRAADRAAERARANCCLASGCGGRPTRWCCRSRSPSWALRHRRGHARACTPWGPRGGACARWFSRRPSSSVAAWWELSSVAPPERFAALPSRRGSARCCGGGN